MSDPVARQAAALAAEDRQLPHLPCGEEYDRLLNELVEKVNGFVYPGDRAYAVIDTVRVLRAEPALARALLADPEDWRDAAAGLPLGDVNG